MVVLALPNHSDFRIVNIRAVVDHATSKKLSQTKNLTKGLFAGTRRNRRVAIKSHQKVSVSIDIARSRGLPENWNNKDNGTNILCGVLYAEERKLENAYNNMALLSCGAYTVKMALLAKLTILYQIVSWINTGATLNLTNAAIIEPRWNSCIRRQKIPRLWQADEKTPAVTGIILVHVRVYEICGRAWLGMVTTQPLTCF